ncbi:hypothetical protein GC169_01785 [bacterium]|nr:hypothetical protein [bacterium]
MTEAHRPAVLRVLVVGISGSGKTTFSSRLAAATGIPHTDLDAVNWRPGWRDRTSTDRESFIADIDAASAAPAWTISGSYHSTIGDMLWSRATDAVWMDLPRLAVMAQVIPRSLQRALSGADVFPGCRETPARLFGAEHPIRYAWDNHARRRERYEQVSVDPAYADVRIHRCRSRREGDAAMARLVEQARA